MRGFLVCVAALGGFSLNVAASTADERTKPNLIYILVDDWGHYDNGHTNANLTLTTPTLNALAGEGIILDRHYTYQFCSPTRSSFLSGRLPLHVNTENNPSSEPGGVDLRMETISERLKAQNYTTAVVNSPFLPLKNIFIP